MEDGHLVSRDSDFIIYSVEAEAIDKVVGMYARCTWVPFTALQTSGRSPY